MNGPIVIPGGSGVIGARLSQALVKDAILTIIVADRALQKAQSPCLGTLVTPLVPNGEAPDLPPTLRPTPP